MAEVISSVTIAVDITEFLLAEFGVSEPAVPVELLTYSLD